MITVSKGVLKAKMLAYFRQVEETGETLVVTDHRKPVLRIGTDSQRAVPGVSLCRSAGEVAGQG